MHCCYINLAQATKRRVAIEASFSKSARPGWTLSRFAAIDTAHVNAQGTPGRRTRREKACFLSHKTLIETHAEDGRHLLVLEDDTQFGRATCEIVDGFLQQNPEGDWDILFLDVAALKLSDMMTLYFHRQTLMCDQKIVPLDLSKMSFIGANAYIVNAASRHKVLACLEAGMPVDVEYDIHLSNQITAGSLKAAVLFPFLVTLSPQAADSQIQRSSMETINRARNIFRNMMWLESEPELFHDSLQTLQAEVANSKHGALATILAAQFLSENDRGFNADSD